MQYLELFDERYIRSAPRSGSLIPRDLTFLKKNFNVNINHITDFYMEKNFSVKNNHILSRIIEQLPGYSGVDDLVYMDRVIKSTPYLSKYFKITSDIEYGLVHPPYFFGNKGEEILMSTFDYFNIDELKSNWKTAKPIKVIKQPRNDDRYLLPLGNDDGNRSGLAVCMINIPMLAMKYREFLKQQSTALSNGEAALNKNNFVIKYVLPTMMEDIVDQTILNKLMDKFYGRETIEPKFKHRFPLMDVGVQLDRYLDDTLEFITANNYDFVNILRNIKLLYKDNAAELLMNPDLGFTMQSKWAMIVSKLDVMVFLIDAAKDIDMNRHYINDWKKLVVRFKNEGILKEVFSNQLYTDIREKIKRIEDS